MTVRILAFRELDCGTDDSPSLRDSEPLDAEVKRAVLHYLRESPVMAASGVLCHDVETGAVIGPYNGHTDGRWVWYSDVPHYVETRDAPLPSAFVEVATTREPPEMTVDELMRVVHQVREQ